MYFQFLANNIDLYPENLRSNRLSGMAEIALRADYGAAMRRPYADMPLSRRGGEEYLLLRRQRRGDLEAILRAGITADNREKALDIICAICEEPWWAENITGPFDDDAHPHIDIMAAETAVLMAWALNEGGFVPIVRARMLRELRRRIFTPLIAHDDYDCMKMGTPRALSVLADVLTAAAMVERDRTRLMTLVRRVAPAADAMAEAPNTQPIKDALADWTTAAAAWRALRTLAGPQPIARQLPLPMWLDTILFSHLGDGMFADKAGGGVVSGLNGADIYYLGKCAGDDAVEALGAYVWQQSGTNFSAVTARIMTDFTVEMTANTEGAPRFRHAALNDMSIMSARGAGAFALMHAGGKANAGAMCIYMDGAPVILACGADGIMIDGMPLTDANGIGDGDFDDDRADMSMDVTPALPKGSAARFMQRTLMLDRESGMTRVIDMIECDRQCTIKYTFDAVNPPECVNRELHIGSACVTLEGGAAPEIRRAEGGIYKMSFSYSLTPGSNMVNMIIEHV